MARVDAWLKLARFALERAIAGGDDVVTDHAKVAVHRVDKALARRPRSKPAPASDWLRPTPRPAAGSCYRCTCGYELAGAELAAFLESCGSSTPASIGCKHCGGVAVRMTGDA